MDYCRERPEVIESGIEIPRLDSLRKLIDSGVPLGNPALKREVEQTGDEELSSVLAWSEAVNARIAEVVKKVPPFKWVIESLEQIRANSDSIVVSQTPVEALVREWTENDIAGYVSVIAGQELGTKTEHIAMATEGKYETDNVLMIGDAPGDRKAAAGNSALFYPVNPAHEEESWERFHREAYGRFLAGDYRGEYQDRLVAEFEALLPENPPWK
jgi:phosphoglycolate phosphatase-like HAD superfamily hydrolase